MIDKLNKKDRVIVYSLLAKVMDADNIQDQREKDLLADMRDRFSLNDADVEQAHAMELDKCKKQIAKFSDDKRHELQELLIQMAFADGKYVEQERALIDSLQLEISHYELELIADWRDEDRIIVGCYNKNDNGDYVFSDICSRGFSERTYINGDDIIIDADKIPNLQENTYYQFRWTVELDENERGFHIVPKDYKFTQVKPKELVNRLYSIWENSDSDVIRQLSDVQRMVNTQLTASSDGTFIYELLQNANDYPIKIGDKPVLVEVEFHLTDNYLIYRHTGREFSPRNIAAISKMSAGEKKKEKNAIGYKGIGFKTVFSENDYVYLKTGDYSLRFDESITQESRNFPWQIMPIWTDKNEVAEEVKEIMANNRNFHVQMAIRPHDRSKLQEDEKSYEFIFNDIFEDEKDILFIPNIKSVKVFYDGEEQICRTKDVTKWALTKEPLVYTFTQEEIDANNREIIANKRIPEKYKDFEDTRVSFACQRKGRQLLPVDDAKIYCYLPTQVSLGFPFLMNTDMIPTGPRDAFETKIKFNHKIMTIAGGKFVEWISMLIKSGEYDVCSVFSILPDLDNKVENYEDFIEEFGDGFDEAVETTELVPTNDGNFELIKNIVLDMTGLSSSGIMSDEEFLSFAGFDDSYALPHSDLRDDANFNAFVGRYAEDEQMFEVDHLTDLIANEEFQEWLKDQDNNNKFLNFLLENDYLEDLLDEDIFLEDEGNLFKAGRLFYDVDKYLVDLQAFTDHIYFLSPDTREYFKDNEKWNDVTNGAFAEFNPDEWVDDIILSTENKSETIERLKDKKTSIHFFKFMAENVKYCDEYLELPFFDDKNECIDNFINYFVFFSSSRGHEICKKKWLSGINFAFLSDKYSPRTQEYFKENFSVEDYTDEFIIKNVILNDDYRGDVKESIQEDFETNKDFVFYCFSQKEHFKSGDLDDFALSVYDGDGETEWGLVENHIYFQSELFDELSSKEWIESNWMYALDEDYFKGASDKKALKTFFSEIYGVTGITDTRFYDDVVKKKLDAIFDNIKGGNDNDGQKNLDFVHYLDNNYQLIFVERKDEDKFDELVIISDEVHDVDVLSENLYLYDNELKEIIDQEWFPEDLVTLCHPDYRNSKALEKIGVKSYKFSEFYDDVITESIETINDSIDSKEDSIEFHNFIISHIRSLTPDQQIRMKEAKVYLYGQEEAAEKAEGHNILSAKAKELFNKGLVEFSDLDLIDPDYRVEDNPKYWEDVLGNTKFTVNHFFVWLSEHIETFCDTLQDKDLNIIFWRWLKMNVGDKLIKEASSLPVVLKDGNIVNSDEPIYFSDEYIPDAGIERYLGSFDENALFISPDYMDESDNINEWKKFWEKIGVKYAIIDILVDTIIPRLAQTDDESLPKLIADNREALEKLYEDGLVPNITQLRVKAHDGEFYDLSETIYIDCEKEEPFPYIELPNQISFKTADERRLIKDLIDEIEGDIVDTLSEWQQRKLDCYLDMQEDDVETIRNIHFQFINDLALLRNDDRDALKSLERIEQIQILNKDNVFSNASTLTAGSVYKPFFDFESCGVDTLEYVSDAYSTECSEYVGKLFRILKVHSDFHEDDIALLTDRDCALYFWKTYLLKKNPSILPRIIDFIEEGLLDKVACIPTKDMMKCPSDLYYGEQVLRFVKSIEDWENKVPSIQDIRISDEQTVFQKLPFKHSLDFLDALYALIYIKGQDRRVTLLSWMIDKYDETFDEKIQQYREDDNALWNNNKNDPVQIKQLYALDYADNTLEQYFGNNPRIINRDYLPRGESFTEACDILGIDIITADELKMEPVGDIEFDAREKIHKLYALAFAGNINRESWKELYDEYCEKLNSLTLHRCDSILITYTEDIEINQALKRFYYKQGENDFYFVKSLDDKLVYESYVKAFLDYLGIMKDELSFDKAKLIMNDDKSALEDIKEQNALLLDDLFMEELDKLIHGIKRELVGNEADDEDEEAGAYHPTFTTIERPESSDEDELDEDEDEDEDDELPERESEPEHPTKSESYGDTEPAYKPTEHPSQAPAQQHVPQSSPSSQSPQDLPHREPAITHSPVQRSTSTISRPQSPSRRSSEGRPFSHMTGWGGSKKNVQLPPKPFSPDDVNNFGSHGVSRTLDVLEPTQAEIDHINRILGEDLSAEEVADQNYLAQLRLYASLKQRGFETDEDEDDFVRNGHLKNEHTLHGGKYIHKCSAVGGIMYLSPAIWNKVADDNCVVCVYLGPKSNQFMYFNSREEILDWIREDDIVIKLTGPEKAEVVERLYTGVLRGVKGTAYTLIRINSNEKYNSLFAPLSSNAIAEEENEDDF